MCRISGTQHICELLAYVMFSVFKNKIKTCSYAKIKKLKETNNAFEAIKQIRQAALTPLCLTRQINMKLFNPRCHNTVVLCGPFFPMSLSESSLSLSDQKIAIGS